jgi:hypothetical protein
LVERVFTVVKIRAPRSCCFGQGVPPYKKRWAWKIPVGVVAIHGIDRSPPVTLVSGA